jgi:hypothetical protein
MKDRESVTAAAATTSIIHSTQATVIVHGPHSGTQIKIHISIKVAKPMGIVAIYNELVGSWIMTRQISGYREYRRIEVRNARPKSTTFSKKKNIER